jgi:hypothetical protein
MARSYLHNYIGMNLDTSHEQTGIGMFQLALQDPVAASNDVGALR